MGIVLTQSASNDNNYENIEPGSYGAQCIQIVELGTHPNTHPKAKPGDTKRELLIAFEISSELMEDGLPFVVSWRGTESLGEKAQLYKLLSSWRGKPFSQAELAGFELKNILGKPCFINVVAGGKEGKWRNVQAIMPLPKGMTIDNRVNELVEFTVDEIGTPEWAKLWPWVQKIILDSAEGKAYQQIHGTIAVGAKREAPHSDSVIDDTDIPF